MYRLPARVADQENAVVQALGMLVGDISVGALDAAGEVRTDEQVENAIDAVGRDAAPLGLRYRLGNVIGAGRLVESRQRIEHGGAHVGPLLTLAQELVACGGLERLALVQLMVVAGHDFLFMK
jgi:hypothetical protein